MNRFLIAFVAGCCVVVSSASARADGTAPGTANEGHALFSGEHAAKIREEIKLHEQRAHELDPIIARDRQARRDVEVNWVLLERHARDLHARANDFRAYANEGLGPRAQQDMNTFANELDTFATHDEENARWQHEMGDRLDRAVQSESAARDWHLKMAGRLRDWLTQNNF